jgi:hypothetical protein
MRADLTAIQVKAILTMLRDELGEDPDDQLLLDCLEGETDLFALAHWLLGRIEEDEGVMEALAVQMAARKDRRDRAARRIEAHRTAIMAMMEAGGIDKLPLAEATCSLRRMAPKVIITDESLLPDALCKFTRKPDMAAIKFAAEYGPLPGVSLDNGGVSLTIRRK